MEQDSATIRATTTRTVLPGGATLTTVTGSQQGPTLALLGGVHGDEDAGVLAVHRVVSELVDAPLAGKLLAAAPANPQAWAAQSRTGPIDGVNLARCFPGDLAGGPTATLAAGITETVIDGADLLIDLHSAGLRYRMPLFSGFCQDVAGAEASKRAAVAFGAPIVWAHPPPVPAGRSLSVAHERGIPAIYAECGGGGSVRARELDAYVAGVLSVMIEFGMLPESFRRADGSKARWVYGAGDTDAGTQASHHGFFVNAIGAGAEVRKGDELGRLYDYQGELVEVVRALEDGVVMFLRREARTKVGEVLYILADQHPDDR